MLASITTPSEIRADENQKKTGLENPTLAHGVGCFGMICNSFRNCPCTSVYLPLVTDNSDIFFLYNNIIPVKTSCRSIKPFRNVVIIS